MTEFATATWLAIFGVVFLGGVVKGLVGFGYALTGTALLATVVDPSTAVVLLILPVLAANLSLVAELDRDVLRSCVRRFWPFVLAAAAGTALGTALLDVVPTALVALVIGVFTLAYVVAKQPWVELPSADRVAAWLAARSTPVTVSVGLVSGVVFGASNIAVQVVAYLDSFSLDRSTFVGVLALVLVGISSLRVGLAWAVGLYGSTGVLTVSALAAVPGVVGVAVGSRARRVLPDAALVVGVLALLALVGVRLTVNGLRGL